ncbi:GNAT family N-acetyltransferase [Vibrio ezurae]|uniref:Putative acetyltransferase n=1 Tax=Vibrio ezurae NBRC 102218 TaxID=1219080 RepID=U3ALD1_9VIBR|nr:GNAT family N-acetyltransferase [Vibrio ezurae]GAD80716.1 putative acetyltransferase [Vibrio ezurae NBRC 102218]
MILQTNRLRLRPWTPSDFNDFIEMNRHPKVMRFFPSCLTPLQSIESARRLSEELQLQGWGMWVVEKRFSKQFVGILGLQQRSAEDGILVKPFKEIAWRLHARYWGQGFASEAAEAVLEYAFEHLNIDAVYSLTALVNLPSQRVMQKIGMLDTQANFQHPRLDVNSTLSWHCLYKITQQQWKATR